MISNYRKKGGIKIPKEMMQKTKDILDWCLIQKDSVNYPISLRWLYYRAMAKFNLEKSKKGYCRFMGYTIHARKEFLRGWKPDSLIDDTRQIYYGYPFDDVGDWLDFVRNSKGIRLQHLDTQPTCIIVCFEAEAMRGQFENYLGAYRLPIIPFRGDASIKLKWDVAKLIEYFNEKYNKPVEVLYFGDHDKKGRQIPESAFKDVRKWCDIEFTVTRIGLLPEHIVRFNMLEDFEKKGNYQWEALTDDNVKELFKEVTDRIDIGAYNRTLERENEIDSSFENFMLDAEDYVTDPKDDVS